MLQGGFLVDISVASTQVLEVKKVPFDNVTAGMAAQSTDQSRTDQKHGEQVQTQRGDNLKVVAFNSTGCPAYKPKLELDVRSKTRGRWSLLMAPTCSP